MELTRRQVLKSSTVLLLSCVPNLETKVFAEQSRLPKLTNQDIFNKVWFHLKTQNKRCYSEEYRVCAYRNEFNESCAVGCLIPDNLYDSSVEGLTVTGSIVDDSSHKCNNLSKILTLIGINKNQYSFLEELQKIHDAGHHTNPWISWKRKLKKTALNYGLSIPEGG